MEKTIKRDEIIGNRKSCLLGAKYPGISFTIQESEVMLLGLQGRSISKIATLMNLSPRTVEFFLCKMQLKLNCKSRAELIEKVSDSDFLKNKQS